MYNDKDFENIGGGDFPPAFMFDKAGDWMIGKFVESHEVKSKKFKSGKATFYTLEAMESSKGEISGQVSVLGSGLLNSFMNKAEVKEGDILRIEYKGVSEYMEGKTKQTAHNWKVGKLKAK